jgi:two-component system response regulator YesN
MSGILIVDDTEIIRSTIFNVISKEMGDVDPVLEAKNGDEAVQLTRLHQPDIVLMDIKMPGINGLQATATIREISPRSKVIMLTAYDEFSFVQEALRLGAVDYLLKPVRPNRLVEVIKAVQTTLAREDAQQQTLTEARQRLSTTLPIVEANLVEDLIYNQPLAESFVQESLNQLAKPLTMPVVMLVGIDEFNKTVKRLTPQQLHKQYAAATTVVKAAVNNSTKALFGSWQLGQMAIILSTDFQWESIETQKELGEKVRQDILNTLHMPVTVSLGGRYSVAAEIPLSFTEARTAHQYNQHADRVVHISDLAKSSTPHHYAYPLTLEKELLDTIRLNQQDISLEIMNELIDTLLYNYKDSPQILCSYFAELLTLVSRTVIDIGAPASIVQGLSHRQMSTLFSSPRPAQLRAWALNSVMELTALIQPEAKPPILDSVQIAIDYIHQNYNNPEITLGDVANTVGLSQSHLAYLLKERLGVSYSKYLSALRLKQAKKLLRTTSMTVSSIAETVGYPNTTNFYRIFNREADMTPKTYRQLKKTV